MTPTRRLRTSDDFRRGCRRAGFLLRTVLDADLTDALFRSPVRCESPPRSRLISPVANYGERYGLLNRSSLPPVYQEHTRRTRWVPPHALSAKGQVSTPRPVSRAGRSWRSRVQESGSGFAMAPASRFRRHQGHFFVSPRNRFESPTTKIMLMRSNGGATSVSCP